MAIIEDFNQLYNDLNTVWKTSESYVIGQTLRLHPRLVPVRSQPIKDLKFLRKCHQPWER